MALSELDCVCRHGASVNRLLDRSQLVEHVLVLGGADPLQAAVLNVLGLPQIDKVRAPIVELIFLIRRHCCTFTQAHFLPRLDFSISPQSFQSFSVADTIDPFCRFR
jgi:hypothetical protein